MPKRWVPLPKEILRVEDLWKSYGSLQVLKGVTLSLMEGVTKVVIGP